MSARDLIRETPGIITDPGAFMAPKGALHEAENVIIPRPGNIQPRGRITYYVDSTMTGSTPIHVARWSDTTWTFYNSSTNPVRKSQTSTLTGPTSLTAGKTWSAATRDRLLFTSDQGVYSIDSTSSTTCRRAGLPVPDAFGAFAQVSGTGTKNWLANTNYTAYRIVYVRYVNSTTPIFSPPSNYTLVQNNQAATGYVRLRICTTLLSDGDEVRIYRSSSGASAPADEMRERAVLKITTGGTYAPNTSFTWDDFLADSAWSGPSLYTNEGQDGALGAKWRPYYAADVAHYNGMAFYAGHKTPQRVTITMRDVGGNADVDDDTVFRTRTDTATTTSGSAVVTTTYDPSTSFRVGQIVTLAYSAGGRAGSADATFQANSKIASFGPGNQFTMDKTATASGGVGVACWDWISCTSGADTQIVYAQPEASHDFLNTTTTARFLVVDDTTADGALGGAQDLARAWSEGYIGTSNQKFRLYWSGARDTDATLTFESLTVDGSAITVKSTKPYAFDRYCDSATGITSAQEGGTNRLAYSKVDEPEAVPILNYVDLGSSTNEIHRVMRCGDSLFVFTTEGLWRVTGTSPETLIFDQFDPTCILFERRLLASSHNRLWAFTRNGPCAVSDGGVSPFGDQVRRLLDQDWNLPTAGTAGNMQNPWAFASQSQNIVAFGAKQLPGVSSTFKWRAYVYNIATDAWTVWSSERTSRVLTCAVSSDHSPYGAVFGSTLGAATYNFTEQIQAIRTGDVLASQTCDITNVAGNTTITIAGGSLWTPTVGDAIGDEALTASVYHVVSVASATEFTVDRAGLTVDNGYTWMEGAASRVRWQPVTGGEPTLDKKWQEMMLTFERFRLGYDITLTFEGMNTDTYWEVTNGGTPALDTFTIASVKSSYSLTAPYAAYPLQLRRSVPSTVGIDYGLRVGFKMTRAGSFWTLGAMCLVGNPIADRSGFK